MIKDAVRQVPRADIAERALAWLDQQALDQALRRQVYPQSLRCWHFVSAATGIRIKAGSAVGANMSEVFDFGELKRALAAARKNEALELHEHVEAMLDCSQFLTDAVEAMFDLGATTDEIVKTMQRQIDALKERRHTPKG
jgi:hypothetical protein